MTNKSYMKGYRKERATVNEARAEGKLAFRSAGSHSPIDVVIINKDSREICLIQCKAGDLTENQRNRLLEQWGGLNGMYSVRFHVQ